MSIITYPLNNVNYSAEDVELYLCTRTSGVWGTTDNFDITLISGLTLTFGKGIAWIKNSPLAGKVVGITEAIGLTFAAAETSLNRIDRVVIGFNAATNQSSLYVKKGTPASSPVAPSRSTTTDLFELVLYDVLRPAGSATILQSYITDQRANPDVCGIMRDPVTGAVPDSRKINGKVLTSDISLTVSDIVNIGDSASKNVGTGANNVAAGNHTHSQYVDTSEFVEITRFTTSGTFDAAAHPTKDGRYLIMLLGAGGGSYHNSSDGLNYSSGGAGAMQYVDFKYVAGMTKSAFGVVIGAAAVNSDGGLTSFDNFRAPGGGKASGTSTPGAGGSISAFTGQSGSSLHGGDSLFGTGAVWSPDTAATGYGAGGCKDRVGTGGLVIVYGYPV